MFAFCRTLPKNVSAAAAAKPSTTSAAKPKSKPKPKKTTPQDNVSAATTKTSLHPSGLLLKFDARSHTYSMDGKTLRSVSSVLDSLFPFDVVGVSEAVARRQFKTPDEVRAEWRRQAQLGSNIHHAIEMSLLQKKFVGLDYKFDDPHGGELEYLCCVEQFLPILMEDFDFIALEHMVASPANKYNVAGTIDAVAKNKHTGQIVLFDWKTSSSRAPNPMYENRSLFDTPAEGPLSHISNTKLNRYAMQLLTYRQIVAEEGYTFKEDNGKELKRHGKKINKKSITTPSPSLSYDPEEIGIELVQMYKSSNGFSVELVQKTVTSSMVAEEEHNRSCAQVIAQVLMPSV
eukprot:PhM_4_TR14200/c0_g1_i1/m.70148